MFLPHAAPMPPEITGLFFKIISQPISEEYTIPKSATSIKPYVFIEVLLGSILKLSLNLSKYISTYFSHDMLQFVNFSAG